MTNTLGKNNRIKSRRLTGILFEQGAPVINYPVRAVFLFVDEPVGLQAGFTAPGRYFKKATDRNRIKRLLREGYRVRKKSLELALNNAHRNLLVFLIYTGKTMEDSSRIPAAVNLILGKLEKLAAKK